jgi:opacity protein-like surface antigen
VRIVFSTYAFRIAAKGPSIRCAGFTKVLLGTLLVLSLLSLGSNPIAAQLTSADQPRPDFRFRQPWVTLGIRGGYVFNRANGEIYTFLTEKLTLDSDDFNAGGFQLDVAVRALSWLDVVFGFEYNYSSSRSEFRNFKEAITDAPIKQDTELTQVPLTTSLKLYPLGRGRQVGEYAWIRSTLVPYVGGGLGATWYWLKQHGDFVDESDCTPLLGCTIFSDKISTSAWAFSKHVFAGLDLKLTRNFGLVVEGRYQWARATVKRDYVGFERINLDGARVMVGFSFRI